MLDHKKNARIVTIAQDQRSVIKFFFYFCKIITISLFIGVAAIRMKTHGFCIEKIRSRSFCGLGPNVPAQSFLEQTQIYTNNLKNQNLTQFSGCCII